MTMKKVSYSDAVISANDIKAVTLATKNGWGKNHNLYIKKFEEKFRKIIGAKYALAVSSCTGAIHLALSSFNFPKNSEIILADSNWIATLSPIIHLGYKPVLVDVDIKNWCIDPKKIENKITRKTKCIIATHLYGNLCDMKSINRIAKKYNLKVIEDCAESLGSKINNIYTGNFSDIACFSFHGSKTITTGEGGMLITKHKKYFDRAEILNNHGRTKDKYYGFLADEIGYKFKMTNMQAAIGLSQLNRLKEKVVKKREIFKNFKKLLSDLDLSFNPENPGEYNSFWMTTIVFNKKYKINVFKLLGYLRKKKIDSRTFFPPLSLMKKFKNSKKNKNSYFLYRNSINLPSPLGLTNNQAKIVSFHIKKYLKKYNGR
jgi:perosamine synthetase